MDSDDDDDLNGGDYKFADFFDDPNGEAPSPIEKELSEEPELEDADEDELAEGEDADVEEEESSDDDEEDEVA